MNVEFRGARGERLMVNGDPAESLDRDALIRTVYALATERDALWAQIMELRRRFGVND